MHFRFPDFLKPNAFTFEILDFNLSITWYSLSYILGIICAWFLIYYIAKKKSLWNGESPLSTQNIEDLMTYLILGIILGGRMGYVLFYNPEFYWSSPIRVLYLWEGGMSFHGGFLGVMLGGLYYSIRNKKPLLSMGDIIAVSTPPGLLLGRLANFTNQELWGKPTTYFLGIEFTKPPASICPETWELENCIRHPSQLYEALLEGLLLGIILLVLVFIFKFLKYKGRIMGIFLFGYGCARIFVEFYREADPQYITVENYNGYIIKLTEDLGFSMGQTLSIPMLLVGIIFIIFSLKKPTSRIS
tara:strand:- start:31 stop:933 length:903 start_codon:yes stop_codon:yes gene_type:complete